MRRLPVALVLAALLLVPSPAASQEAPPHADEVPPRSGKAPSPAAAKPAQAAQAVTHQPAKPQPAKPGSPKPQHTPGPAVKNDGKRYLRSLDENHDGRISKKEFLARAREQFAELDLDRDGALSPRELDKAREKARAKRDEARRRAGKPPISREADQARKPLLSGLADRDLDGDGRITLKEYLARRERQFAELDRNHDGIIAREEAKAEKGRILARRAELKAEKRAVAQRQAQRQAAREEKRQAGERRAARHEEIVAEREARGQRRVARMTRQAEGQWGLSPEAAALAPEPPAPATPAAP